MRLAIPIWSERISPVFDSAANLLVADYEDGRETDRQVVALDDLAPALRAARLRDLGVEVLLCGAVSGALAQMIQAQGVRVIPWLEGSVDEAVSGFIEGGLRPAGTTCPRGRQSTRGGGRGRRRQHGCSCAPWITAREKKGGRS